MDKLTTKAQIEDLSILDPIDGREVVVIKYADKLNKARIQDLTTTDSGDPQPHTHSIENILTSGNKSSKTFLSSEQGGSWVEPSIQIYDVKIADYLSFVDWRLSYSRAALERQFLFYHSLNYDGNSSQMLTYTDLHETFPLTGTYVSALLLLDGRVALIPKNSNPIVYLDLDGPDYSESSIILTDMENSFSGAVLLESGFICLIPANEHKIVVVDPNTDTIVKELADPGVLIGQDCFRSGSLVKNKVLLTPYKSTFLVLYDFESNSVEVINEEIDYGEWVSSVSTDGRVVFIPYMEARPFIFDLEGPTHVTNSSYTLNGGFVSCTTMMDGMIFCLPSIVPQIVIYDPVSDEPILSDCTVPPNQSYRKTLLFPDGRVILVPYYTFSPAMYDGYSDTLSSLEDSAPAVQNTMFDIAVSLSDGSCLMLDSTQNTIFRYVIDSLVLPFPPSLTTSPVINKG